MVKGREKISIMLGAIWGKGRRKRGESLGKEIWEEKMEGLRTSRGVKASHDLDFLKHPKAIASPSPKPHLNIRKTLSKPKLFPSTQPSSSLRLNMPQINVNHLNSTL